jgi:hypothetical protein
MIVAITLALAGCASDSADNGTQVRDVFPGGGAQPPPKEAGPVEPPEAPRAVAGLSPQAQLVSQIAARNGDPNFLMVDKLRGQIFLFRNGAPVFSDPALTGASGADHFAPGTLAMSFSHPLSVNEKVTPAGRFTITIQNDKHYGTTFDITEIRGKDWGIAIHPVYLGLPYEHRLARLRSASAGDKHITFGCINIAPEAIRYLAARVPATGPTPLYILPSDESHTAAYFARDAQPGSDGTTP